MSAAYCLQLGAIVFCMASCKPMPADVDVESIRKTREASNMAIARQDTAALASTWMDNFLLISSRDSQVDGRDQNARLFAQEFRTKDEVIYVRTPAEIKVMPGWEMASEYGNWIGRWKDGDDKIEIGGNYFAKWHKVDGRWLLRAEVFVPLHCQGGPYCKEKPN